MLEHKRGLLGLAGAAVALILLWHIRPTEAVQRHQPAPLTPARLAAQPLPVAHVILFNSGVGYFQREGEVQDNVQIDLSFPATDVNDLLKSLVLQDQGNGAIRSISYDSQDPVEKTLKSFALDLTSNPTLGQILNQARGEKIEATLLPGNVTQAGTVIGTIVGMESEQRGAGEKALEVHSLNLLCAAGMRTIPLSQVQSVRFLNPVLESEFSRALAVLASAHDMQKKSITLNLSGEGKRQVKVGYVVENPIWKSSYRLLLDGNGKSLLQGWAIVENSSDDDWNNVRMVLVSGRPISFQMDLYQPLYVPRPTLEPELFASLRPPTYSGNLDDERPRTNVARSGGLAGGLGGLGGIGGLGINGGANNLGIGGGQAGMAGGQNLGGGNFNNFNRYQLGNQLGIQGGGQNGQFGQGGEVLSQNQRLTFEEFQERRKERQANNAKARKVGSALAAQDLKGGVASVADAEEIGDSFQYVIDHPVSLSRQKSALLPIVRHEVEATKVSIFNEGVHAQFPLLGLKFKNTSGQNLMQGPVTVYERGAYAGDGRVMDLQPNEERLISYAIDQGTEVQAQHSGSTAEIVAVKVVKGILQTTHKLRQNKNYQVKNRSGHDRTLLIEHPYRSDWSLVSPAKAAEQSRDVYRFQLAVPAGQSARQEVIEEQTQFRQVSILGSDDNTVRLFLRSTVSSPKVKEALQQILTLRAKLADTQRELAQLEQQLKAITDDQSRLRANLEKVPSDSAAHKRYLAKFDSQETEIEKLQQQIKEQRDSEKQQTKEYEDFLAGVTVS
jgi:hypothetical protein